MQRTEFESLNNEGDMDERMEMMLIKIMAGITEQTAIAIYESHARREGNLVPWHDLKKEAREPFRNVARQVIQEAQD